ncbi:MAG: hypothetical protein ACO35C_04325 [Pontimonas sp.]
MAELASRKVDDPLLRTARKQMRKLALDPEQLWQRCRNTEVTCTSAASGSRVTDWNKSLEYEVDCCELDCEARDCKAVNIAALVALEELEERAKASKASSTAGENMLPEGDTGGVPKGKPLG